MSHLIALQAWPERGHSCPPHGLPPQDAVRNVRAPLLGRVLFLGGTLLTLSAARGENWPEFRGPTGQGRSAAHNLPVEWSATKNVAWKQPIRLALCVCAI